MTEAGSGTSTREWQDVDFDDAGDMSPHLSMEGETIVVDHPSLLAAMTRTESADWRRIATPVPPKAGRDFMWFGCAKGRLTARVEDERGVCWAASVFDSDDATEMATLCVPLDASLLSAE